MHQKSGVREEHTIYSQHLQNSFTFTIYYPMQFSPLLKHELLIAQDGQDYFNLGKIHRVVDQLMKDGAIQPTIIVGLPYESVDQRFSFYHPSQPKQTDYIRFLAEELLPFLDHILPTLGLAHGRTLIGDSLGATVSLQAAFQYPHSFGKVILQSPFVNEVVTQFIQETILPVPLSIYQTVGTEETNVLTTSKQFVNFVEGSHQLKDLLQKLSIEYVYQEFEGDHTWTNWEPQLLDLLKLCLRK
jgi:enterochelin esterase-like enzyme